MNEEKRRRLEAAGFESTTVEAFLGLTPEESAFIELKLRLSALLRRRREAGELSQAAVAERMRSSQSRVAKAEAGDPNVTIDLLIRAVFATGASTHDIGVALASPEELLSETTVSSLDSSDDKMSSASARELVAA